jgi:uncharacterized protein YbcI
MPPGLTTDAKSKATAISNGIGALHREHYGRGADRIRTVLHGNLVVTTLEDCFTPVEKKMIAEGAFTQVRETRTMSRTGCGRASLPPSRTRPDARCGRSSRR